STFTKQTNVVDVDKHMLQYIEEEMERRRKEEERARRREQGQEDPDIGLGAEEEEKARARKREGMNQRAEEEMNDEGSVALSNAMLTSVAEVDLGMETRLKNMEATERAKRQWMEEQKVKKKGQATKDSLLASTRFYQPSQHRTDKDRQGHGGSGAQNQGRPSGDDGGKRKPLRSTDQLVLDRFKKRQRR
ncbi:hepatocellular carcinoma-associated antigen 59-domain-containing protein, partial [Piptocephalis cylindrospora]